MWVQLRKIDLEIKVMPVSANGELIYDDFKQKSMILFNHMFWYIESEFLYIEGSSIPKNWY